MSTAQQFLAACAADIGYAENPPGSNCTRFAAEAGHPPCQPWCSSWLIAKARQTGLRLPSESPYTPTLAQGFRDARRWGNEPRIGAFCFWDFPDSKHRIQHVDVVESFTTSTITTLGGNTAGKAGGSEDNGGMVARRTRNRAYIVGFGYPEYDEPVEGGDVPAPTDVTAELEFRGGHVQLTYDGGVRFVNGATWPHAGPFSYPGLPAGARQGTRGFYVIVAGPKADGYTLVATDGSRYSFPL